MDFIFENEGYPSKRKQGHIYIYFEYFTCTHKFKYYFQQVLNVSKIMMYKYVFIVFFKTNWMLKYTLISYFLLVIQYLIDILL